MPRADVAADPPGSRGWVRAAVVVALLVIAAGCASRFTPPTGLAQPVAPAEVAAIWTTATAGCEDLQAFNAEVRPSGRVAGSRVRGLELLVAVETSGRVGLEALAGGQTVFTLRGTAEAATLWLPRERRVVVAPANTILARLVGLDIEPARLLSLFGGCVALDRTPTRVDRVGEMVRVTTPDTVVYLEAREGGWGVRGGTFGPFVADYRSWAGRWPREIGIRSVETYDPSVDVQLAVGVPRINPELPEAAFTVSVPPDAVSADVMDLRPFWDEGS